LGVLKFNLKNPSSIFLHATSRQSVFAKNYRFLSHGCIRLEKPFALADALLRGKINIAGLKKEKKDTQSSTINLPHKVPTFIIYMPVKIVGSNLVFLQDVYDVLK
jgi:L,D-transpeptidase YcbB